MKRVTVPASVAMPHICCSCGTSDDVHLVSRARRAYLLAALAVAAVLGVGLLAIDDKHPLGPSSWTLRSAIALAIFAAFPAWRMAPQLRKRPVKLIRFEKRQGFATLGCANKRFADALADQNKTGSEATLPRARLL
jgi:hypothetical protein